MISLFTRKKARTNPKADRVRKSVRVSVNRTRERMQDKLDKDDFLLSQIDEFREKAKQLQEMLSNKETKANELQSIVAEREEKAEELLNLFNFTQSVCPNIPNSRKVTQLKYDVFIALLQTLLSLKINYLLQKFTSIFKLRISL